MRVDLTGNLDPRLLMSALRGTVRRHDVLRATLDEGPDGPRQTVRTDFTVPVRQREYGDLDEAAREEVIRRAAKAEARLPFDLVREIPLRLRVLRFTATRSAVLVVTHHIAFDGWSRNQLVADVAAHYRARVEGTAAPEPLAFTYTDFAAWQVAHRAVGGTDASRAYWLDRLAAPYPDLRLPGALGGDDEYRSATQPVAVPAAALASVARLARKENTTDFTVLLAVFLLAMASRSGAPETMAAIQVANRRWPGTQKLVGLFANTLVLRTLSTPPPPSTRTCGRSERPCWRRSTTRTSRWRRWSTCSGSATASTPPTCSRWASRSRRHGCPRPRCPGVPCARRPAWPSATTRNSTPPPSG